MTGRRDRRQAQPVVPEQLRGQALNRRRIHRVDRGQRVIETEDAIVQRLLPAEFQDATWRVSSIRSSIPPAR